MSSVRALPLWVRYVATFTVAVALFVALVIYVHHHNGPLSESAASPDANQARQEATQNYRLAVQQESPHRASARPREAAIVAATAAVGRWFAGQVDQGFVPGPVSEPTRCTGIGPESVRRARFNCNAYAGQGADRLRYPFAAVVDLRARQVTFCEIVTPIYPSYPSATVPVPGPCR